MEKVLLIEDDLDMQSLIIDYLGNYDFEVHAYDKPKVALEVLQHSSEQYAVIVLDLMLPQIDGFDVCKKIREFSFVPIIISSARGELSDKILCYECGADDYLAKPYEPRELVLRINAILRRTSSDVLKVGDFEIDAAKREVKVEGYSIELTQVEYDLLDLLVKNRGKVLSREVLSNGVNGIEYHSNDRAIDMHISNLRYKIGDTPKAPKYIKSVWGIGYKFIG